MNALLFGGLRQNLPSSFSLTGMAHKKEIELRQGKKQQKADFFHPLKDPIWKIFRSNA